LRTPLVFFIGKVLTALASPVALSLLALLYAGFSRRRTSRFACFIAAILLVLFGSESGSRFFLRSLESRYRSNTVASAPAAPAIVVLGGGLANVNDPARTVELGQNSERLWTAVELYRAGKSPLILVSGGNAFPNKNAPNVAESALAARMLRAWDVPPAAILTEEESRETHENAVFSQRILAQKGIDRILLVTSAVHLPRASATFRRAGFTVFPVPADYLVSDENQGILLSILPNAAALADSGLAIKEWIGIVAYRLRGWAI
jgi:uncharacterized SAM-binding protein YcdF (DUF218 family)